MDDRDGRYGQIGFLVRETGFVAFMLPSTLSPCAMAHIRCLFAMQTSRVFLDCFPPTGGLGFGHGLVSPNICTLQQ